MAGYASPEAAVRAAFAALTSADWDAFVALVHPADLARFREHEITRLRQLLAGPFPRGAPPAALVVSLFGATSPEELAATPPQEVLRRHLAPHHPERPASDDYEPPTRTRDLLGGVEEPPDLWHFVYRLTLCARYGPARVHRETLEVASARKAPDGWYVLPNEDVTGDDMGIVIRDDGDATPGSAA